MKVIVIGGGAAGFFGAIAAAENGHDVTILEATSSVLAKVRVSGGGRVYDWGDFNADLLLSLRLEEAVQHLFFIPVGSVAAVLGGVWRMTDGRHRLRLDRLAG